MSLVCSFLELNFFSLVLYEPEYYNKNTQDVNTRFLLDQSELLCVEFFVIVVRWERVEIVWLWFVRLLLGVLLVFEEVGIVLLTFLELVQVVVFLLIHPSVSIGMIIATIYLDWSIFLIHFMDIFLLLLTFDHL